jgi:hypothetical protein
MATSSTSARSIPSKRGKNQRFSQDVTMISSATRSATEEREGFTEQPFGDHDI